MPKKILEYIHCFKEVSDMPGFKALMETNVYAIKGKVLVVGACLPDVFPESVKMLAEEAEQVNAGGIIDDVAKKIQEILGLKTIPDEIRYPIA